MLTISSFIYCLLRYLVFGRELSQGNHTTSSYLVLVLYSGRSITNEWMDGWLLKGEIRWVFRTRKRYIKINSDLYNTVTYSRSFHVVVHKVTMCRKTCHFSRTHYSDCRQNSLWSYNQITLSQINGRPTLSRVFIACREKNKMAVFLFTSHPLGWKQKKFNKESFVWDSKEVNKNCDM